MEMPLNILCPGQGAQAVGMGKAWYGVSVDARAVFDEADQVLGSRLGASLTALCFEGPPEKLNRTDISQPAIYTTGVACWRALLAKWGKGEGEVPVRAMAGLSLGEYTALHLSGAFSFRDGLELVALRGRAMQEAAEAVPSGMLALIGADEAAAQGVCEEAKGGGGGTDVLVCANFNAPGQVVLSGSKSALERAASVAAAKGLRSAALPVAGAFHSPLMAPAAERLRKALEQTPIKEPRNVVVSNVTAKPHAGEGGRTMADSIRGLLVRQLTSPVRWAESCAWMVEHARSSGGGEFHEVAPGVTLAGLMRRIDKGTKVLAHDQP
jgi:[acyl-carrier-protein] S-malonyltransferase